MVRISEHTVRKEILLQISEKLIEHVARVKTKKHARSFFLELFTETERIMLAKRFAILVLLEQGYSFSVIIQTLKVSQSTIARIVRDKKQGKFNFLIQQIGTRAKKGIIANNSDFLLSLEILLRAGLPPQGRGRWRTFYRLTEPVSHIRKKSKRK